MKVDQEALEHGKSRPQCYKYLIDGNLRLAPDQEEEEKTKVGTADRALESFKESSKTKRSSICLVFRKASTP